MASWKKMAEAFGRASVRENNTKSGRQFIKNAAKAYADDSGVDNRFRNQPRTRTEIIEETANRPSNNEVGRAFRKGQVDGESRNLDVADASVEQPNKSFMELSDEIDERASDKRLVANREKEWDDAFKQSTDAFKAQSSLLDNEDADVWRSELLRTIDILRKRGLSDDDILNIIKGK